MKFMVQLICPVCCRPVATEISLDTDVAHLIVNWHDDAKSVKTGPAVIGWYAAVPELPLHPGVPGVRASLLLNLPRDDGKRLHLSVATNIGGACLGDPKKPDAFGLKKIHSGVWTYEPSLHIPNLLHAFVVVTGVTDPAPWERGVTERKESES